MRYLALLAFTGVGALASTPFRLGLPDFFAVPLEGGQTIVEVPSRPLKQMDILIRNGGGLNIDSGTCEVRVNGVGITNVFDQLAVRDGYLLRMTEGSARRRPDELFDPEENAIEVIAKDRRGRKYYQNWIVRTSNRQANPLFIYSATRSTADPEGIAPEIVLTQPLAPPVIARDQQRLTIHIEGTLAAGAPGSSLTINGKPHVTDAQSATVPIKADIEIDRSTREIVLEAIDRKRHQRKVIIPVSVQSRPAPSFRFPGQRYALVIGVSQYGTTEDAPGELKGAAAEAAEFAAVLKEKAGFPASNVHLVTDDKATLEQVRVALSDMVQKAQGNDLLVIYIIARGLHDRREGRTQDLYLAVHGTRMSLMDSTALSFVELHDLLGRSVRANQTFLIFDVGHEVAGEQRNLVNNHLLHLFREEEGRSVIVSGSADEVSQQTRSRSRSGGLFRHWMAAGLAGDADVNADSVISAAELFRFVAARVKQESNGQQNPRFRLSASSDVPLATGPAPANVSPPPAAKPPVKVRPAKPAVRKPSRSGTAD
jgi:hypothetical protein